MSSKNVFTQLGHFFSRVSSIDVVTLYIAPGKTVNREHDSTILWLYVAISPKIYLLWFKFALKFGNQFDSDFNLSRIHYYNLKREKLEVRAE